MRIRRPWTVQPPFRTELINGGINKDLTFAGYGNAHTWDFAARTPWTTVANPAWTPIHVGRAWRTNGTTQYLKRFDGLPDTTRRKVTIACAWTPRTLAVNLEIMSLASTASNNPHFGFQIDGSTASTLNVLCRNDDLSVAVNASLPGSLTLNEETVMIATWDGATATLYAPKGTATATFGGTATTTNNVALGAWVRTTEPVIPSNGDFSWYAGWNRCLSAAEARSLIVNRWQMFAMPSRFYAPAPTAAPGGFQAAWASQRSRIIGAGVL